jgi:hypothetical protein
MYREPPLSTLLQAHPGSIERSMDTIQRICVRRANTRTELDVAMELRYQGYKKYGVDWEHTEDKFDAQSNAVILLAYKLDGNKETPLGTLRILDASSGCVEIEDCVKDLSPFTQFNRNFAEATRFTVIHCGEKVWVKLALWKAFHRYCLGMQLPAMLVWLRKGARKDYEKLLFSPVSGLSFKHSGLGSKEYESFYIDLVDLEQRYRERNHPLHSFIFRERHHLINPF